MKFGFKLDEELLQKYLVHFSPAVVTLESFFSGHAAHAHRDRIKMGIFDVCCLFKFDVSFGISRD
jgi:hypothetical protein